MAQFMIDTDAVRQKAAQVEGLSEQYDALRAKLLQTATTMGTAYESADNKVYVARITECCQELKKVSDRLRNAAVLMKKQSGTYDNTESYNASQASRLP